MSKPTVGARTPTRALDRGLLILETIAERPPLTLAEISAACDMSPATALRILRTLETRAFVSRDPETRAYWIGIKAFEVGTRFLSETRLSETVRLILRRLSSTTGQSAVLAILTGADIVYIDVHEGSFPLRSAPQIGMRAPAHATAAGKCLLAERWSDSLADAIGPSSYAAATERTLTSRDALREELGRIRRNGLAMEHGELQPDISNAACAVRDRSGEAIAAMALQSPTSLMEAHAESWTPLLRKAAAESSHRLGWRDRSPHGPGHTDTHIID